MSSINFYDQIVESKMNKGKLITSHFLAYLIFIGVSETSHAQKNKNFYNEKLSFYSRNGAKIIFAKHIEFKDEHANALNADGSNQFRQIAQTSSYQYPVWSLEDSKIAFYSKRNGNYEIYLMNTDHSHQLNHTNYHSGKDYPPTTWSPDDSQIAFYSEKDGNYEIYLMKAEDSDQTRLINSSIFDRYPSWSSESFEISFVSNRDGNREIYVANTDGSDHTRLTYNTSHDYNNLVNFQQLFLEG